MTDLIYLDYNCFQRGFDDPRQTRIRMEALACQDIFIKAELEEINLIWSFMHDDETSLCPFVKRKLAIASLANLCKIKIPPHNEIYQIAQTLQQQGNFSAKDVLHVACANYAKANFFLTCDDQLLKQLLKLSLSIQAMNPIDYIRLEMT
jgi:predicted nucleic acid-binding protein